MEEKTNDGTAFYQDQLAQLAEMGRLRRCRMAEPVPVADAMADAVDMRVSMEGRIAVNFSSNDYLGLARDPRLKHAAMAAVERYGVGSGGSRLVSGTQPPAEELERRIAAFKRTEAALAFCSGYQANVSTLQAVLAPGDYVFGDRLNHASILDGCRLSGARWTRYRHLDLDDLETRLKKAPAGVRKWIVTDSVFSMDGDYPDLRRLADLAERHGAFTMVDEAHATGLYGDRGAGLCEWFGVGHRMTLQMGTFSKALGTSGAYIAGSRLMIDTLVNAARGFIYSTAPSPPVLAAAACAVELLAEDPGLRRRLWENVALFRACIEGAGLTEQIRPLTSGPDGPMPDSPIMPLVTGSGEEALRISHALLERGYFVQAIRPPTVPVGSARLRIALSAGHTSEQIEGLVRVLSEVLYTNSSWE